MREGHFSAKERHFKRHSPIQGYDHGIRSVVSVQVHSSGFKDLKVFPGSEPIKYPLTVAEGAKRQPGIVKTSKPPCINGGTESKKVGGSVNENLVSARRFIVAKWSALKQVGQAMSENKREIKQERRVGEGESASKSPLSPKPVTRRNTDLDLAVNIDKRSTQPKKPRIELSVEALVKPKKPDMNSHAVSGHNDSFRLNVEDSEKEPPVVSSESLPATKEPEEEFELTEEKCFKIQPEYPPVATVHRVFEAKAEKIIIRERDYEEEELEGDVKIEEAYVDKDIIEQEQEPETKPAGGKIVELIPEPVENKSTVAPTLLTEEAQADDEPGNNQITGEQTSMPEPSTVDSSKEQSLLRRRGDSFIPQKSEGKSNDEGKKYAKETLSKVEAERKTRQEKVANLRAETQEKLKQLRAARLKRRKSNDNEETSGTG